MLGGRAVHILNPSSVGSSPTGGTAKALVRAGLRSLAQVGKVVQRGVGTACGGMASPEL